jgi:hypothetical protein
VSRCGRAARGLALRDMPFTQGFAALSRSLERHVGNAETLSEMRRARTPGMELPRTTAP